MQGRLFAVAAVIFATVAASAGVANAQLPPGPELFITWSAADSYAPANYAGKILPNQDSAITASLEAINNGKLINLSGQTIYWYENDILLGGGIGDQHFIFHPDGSAPETITLKVEVPDYPTGLLIHEINIPIVTPEAVIEAPYPQGDIMQSPATVQAFPYFFAVTSTSPLSFAWSVNGQPVASVENPQSLQISLPQSTPAGFAVAVTLNIQNSLDSTAASANANLSYKAQP